MPYSTVVLFKCPSCTHISRTSVPAPETSWLEEPSTRNAVIDCDNCGKRYDATVKKTPYRYEVTLVDYQNVEVFSRELTELSDSHATSSGQSDVRATDDPLFEFLSSYTHMTEVLHTYGIGGSGLLKSSAPEINKLVLSGLISAMEAYLANTLMALVAEEIGATENLLLKEDKLSSQKITLFEAWNENLTVERRFRTTCEIRSIIGWEKLSSFMRLHSIFRFSQALNLKSDFIVWWLFGTILCIVTGEASRAKNRNSRALRS